MEQDSYLFRMTGSLVNFLKVGLRITAEWVTILRLEACNGNWLCWLQNSMVLQSSHGKMMGWCVTASYNYFLTHPPQPYQMRVHHVCNLECIMNTTSMKDVGAVASYVRSHHLALNFYDFIVRLCVCYKQQKIKNYLSYKMHFLGTYPILHHSVSISSYRWHLAFSLGDHCMQLQSCCLEMKHYLECVQQLESGTVNLCMNCLQACVHHSINMNCTTLDLTPY
jgi:hypothetical protein